MSVEDLSRVLNERLNRRRWLNAASGVALATATGLLGRTSTAKASCAPVDKYGCQLCARIQADGGRACPSPLGCCWCWTGVTCVGPVGAQYRNNCCEGYSTGAGCSGDGHNAPCGPDCGSGWVCSFLGATHYPC